MQQMRAGYIRFGWLRPALIVSHYVRCQGRGVRLVVAGVSARVLQLFEMTKVDEFFPRIATVEEADRA